MSRPTVTRAATAVALIAGLVVIVLVVRGGHKTHTLRAAFVSAVQVVPGQEVRLAGKKIGTVDHVSLQDGEAVLKLKIDNGPHWPFHRGTIARLNFGLPASYASRFVELIPGPASQPALPDGGILTTADTITPVEFDQLYRIFGPRTRKNFQALLSNASTTLAGHADDLGNDLEQGSEGLSPIAGTVGELGQDRAALNTLVIAASRTSAALAEHNPALRGLIDHTASTFDELQDNAGALRQTLDGLPATLRSSRTTLARLDTSLGGLQSLVDDIKPGAAGLRQIAPTVRDVVGTLHSTAPRLESTLRTGARSIPVITRLVSKATPFLPAASSVLSRLAPMLGCLRDYTPEFTGFLGTWLSFNSNYDSIGHYARGSERVGLITPGTGSNTAQTIAIHPKGALKYAMPRPPGLNAGHPWYPKACGITKDALDPTKDPESHG